MSKLIWSRVMANHGLKKPRISMPNRRLSSILMLQTLISAKHRLKLPSFCSMTKLSSGIVENLGLMRLHGPMPNQLLMNHACPPSSSRRLRLPRLILGVLATRKLLSKPYPWQRLFLAIAEKEQLLRWLKELTHIGMKNYKKLSLQSNMFKQSKQQIFIQRKSFPTVPLRVESAGKLLVAALML